MVSMAKGVAARIALARTVLNLGKLLPISMVVLANARKRARNNRKRRKFSCEWTNEISLKWEAGAIAETIDRRICGSMEK